VILRGEPADLETWQREIARLYDPHRLVLAIPAGATNLPPALADKISREVTTAYVCKASTCSAPIKSMGALAQHLRTG
jgi:uncharacterized protein YyaL (SSP411 family)